MAAPLTPYGSTLVFATTHTISTLHNVKTYRLSGLTRGELDTTHMGTTVGAKVYEPEPFYEPGELSVEGDFDVAQAAIMDNIHATGTVVKGNLVLAIKDAGAAAATYTWTGTAFLKSAEFTAPYNGLVSGTITFALASAPVIT